MPEAHLQAGQQHSVAAEQFLKQAIVPALAVGRIADDRVRQVFQV